MLYIRVCTEASAAQQDILEYDTGVVSLNGDCAYGGLNYSASSLASSNMSGGGGVGAGCDPHDIFYDVNETAMEPMMAKGSQNLTQEDLALEVIRHYIYGVTLPIVFSFGIFGNIMNLIIFTRRRIRSRMSEVEKAATTGLMSLALADLCFCLVGLVSHFLSPFETSFSTSNMAVSAFYYTSYKRALLNTFLFISTWVITVLSIERWAAATYPFLARRTVDVRRSVLINVGVYVLSIVFNIPLFLEDDFIKVRCTPTCWCYAKMKGILRQNPHVHEAYEIIWAIVGTFIPIFLLIFCNIRFLLEIHRSRAQFKVDNKKASRRSNASTGSKATLTRITIILVAIIGMFLCLVCPSSILGFLNSRVNLGDHQSVIRYQIFLVIFNLTQAINFAANFLLYCTMSREFRTTLLKLVLCRGVRCCRPGDSGASTSQNLTTEQPSMTALKANHVNTETRVMRDSTRDKTEWL